MNPRRAVGIVRVSRAGGREGESFASPVEQRNRIAAACERDELKLVAVHDEIDVSGGTALDRRAGLTAAIEAIERREADVLMVAYLDRLVRSFVIQEEIVKRVEAAGGRVVALDFGEVTGGDSMKWLTGGMLAMFNEFYRRSIGERTREAQARAVARGVWPHPNVPPGYRRSESGVLVFNGSEGVVSEAFNMRADGATLFQIRAHLFNNGIERKSLRSVQTMLRSRVYLGEIHWGELVNLKAHEPLIDRDLFERVQSVSVPRGRQAHSDRLLARLGVLRCGICGGRMSVDSGGRRNAFYRCPASCSRRQSIAAKMVEEVVTEAVKHELADVTGRASGERRAIEAAAAAEAAQANLDAAIRTLEGLGEEPAAREKLAALRAKRDRAREEAHRLSHLSTALTVTVEDWDRFTLEGRRALVKAVVERVDVLPGRGVNRIRVHLFEE